MAEPKKAKLEKGKGKAFSSAHDGHMSDKANVHHLYVAE
jgi:hypothetical protein